VTIFAAGTGNPFFTTDTARACAPSRSALTCCSRRPRSTDLRFRPGGEPVGARYDRLTYDQVLDGR